MLRLIQSLSLTGIALLIAVISPGLVWLLASAFPKVPKWIWPVFLPFSLAYCLYWSPVWFANQDSSEYSAWAILFVGIWFFAGFFPSAILVWMLENENPADRPCRSVAQAILPVPT